MVENELIYDVANGDRKSFSLLYRLFSAKVFSTAISYTNNLEEAEEVTQDVFTKIYLNASSFKGNSSASTWIFRITVNTALTCINKRQRLQANQLNIDRASDIDFVHPGIIAENKENAKILYAVLESLPNTQKTAFILSYIEDLPRQEVADIMKTTLKAVESLLQRAKQNMRIQLEKRFPNRRKLNKNKSNK